jgi:FdrA protein
MPAISLLFRQEICVINLGLEAFAQEFERLGVAVVHVQWSPPAGGDAKKAALLAALSDDDEEA